MKNYLEFEKEIKALEQEVDGLKSPFGSEGISEVDTKKIKNIQSEINEKLKESYANLNSWQRTQVARHEDRPKANFYIKKIFSQFTLLSGDRYFGDDKSVIAGFGLINNKSVVSVHDISSGGLIIALIEMSLASQYGLKINKPKTLSNLMEYFFGEDQGRYLIEIEPDNLEKVKKILDENNVFNEIIASVQKDNFEIVGQLKININELSKINNKWYNNY